jgi:hypothetical protein
MFTDDVEIRPLMLHGSSIWSLRDDTLVLADSRKEAFN